MKTTGGDLLRHWLQEKREIKDISQAKLAKTVGVSRQMIHAIENGKRGPSPELAKKIAEVLEFEWTKFF